MINVCDALFTDLIISAMTHDLAAVANSAKEIASIGEWVETERFWLNLVCSLDVDGVTMAGLQLRFKAHKHLIDEEVTVQIEYRRPKTKFEPITRVNWRPLSAHNNKGRGPQLLRFKNIAVTHIHPFELNYDQMTDRMLQPNLPIAIPIDEDLGSVANLLDFCEKTLNIKGLTQLPSPRWQPRMI